MKVVEGKQAVLRSYLSEGQCVKPVQGQYAVPASPIKGKTAPVKYVTESAAVKEAEMSKPRKHFTQVAETQTLTVNEQSVERAAVKELPTVPFRFAAAAVETGHITDVTEEADLTIEQLFSRKQREDV